MAFDIAAWMASFLGAIVPKLAGETARKVVGTISIVVENTTVNLVYKEDEKTFVVKEGKEQIVVTKIEDVSHDPHSNFLLQAHISILEGLFRLTADAKWFINKLPEEYRAHLFDLHHEMIKSCEPVHIIQRALLWFWIEAVVWTPIVSRIQRLIPSKRISS